LNDILIKDASNSRLVRLEVFADDELVTDYLCDGLVFSTPTGSTAYNLSAGGPLIHPSAEVLAMTPICPHTLSNRSIIFRAGVRLRVQNLSDHATGLIVAADGRALPAPPAAAPITISLSPHRLRLIQRRDHSHFSIVRAKLKWSGGAAQDKR
jgi:NAD+ kinase